MRGTPSLSSSNTERNSRIVRHGLQHGIIELDGPGDEQRGMGCLGGHSGVGICF